MKIKKIDIFPVQFPLTNRFQTHLGSKIETRNVLVVAHGSSGMTGYGEASSSLAMPEATQSKMAQTLRQIASIAAGQPILLWRSFIRRLIKKFTNQPTAVSAVECALLDLFCKTKGIPMNRAFGKENKTIQTYFTIPLLPAKKCEEILIKMSKQGFKKYKVKVCGEEMTQEIKRVELAWNYACQEPLIIDANQGWSLSFSLKFVDNLLKKNIPVAFIEQPFARNQINEFKQFKKRSPFSVAADESVRNIEDAMKFVQEDAADIFNLKLAKSGLIESIRMARYLRKMKKKLMIGCMMESALGIAASVFWASGSGWFDFIDLDSFLLIKPLPIKSGFKNSGPAIWADPAISGSGTEISLRQMDPWIHHWE